MHSAVKYDRHVGLAREPDSLMSGRLSEVCTGMRNTAAVQHGADMLHYARAQSVIARERRGDYLGRTVQVIPHITDAVKQWIDRVAHIPVDGRYTTPDVCTIELGGTVRCAGCG
jgi:hypothetical protein